MPEPDVVAEASPGTCDTVDFCKAHPLPSQISTLEQFDLADVIVANLGLHVHTHEQMGAVLRDAFHELDAFASARPGRAVLFREVSNQHFASETGDYDDAVMKDPRLVRHNTTEENTQEFAASRWMGPSMCKPHSDTLAGYRNQQIHRLYSERNWRMALMPFDALTRERWDYHQSTRWFPKLGARGMFVSDCTHYCFSPRFWELVTHDLYVSLSNASAWLHKRHQRASRGYHHAAGSDLTAAMRYEGPVQPIGKANSGRVRKAQGFAASYK